MKNNLRRNERFEVIITVRDPNNNNTSITETIYVHNRILSNSCNGSGSRPNEAVFNNRLILTVYQMLRKLTNLIKSETKTS